MRTLDEVITALELCSTEDNPCDKCPYTAFDKNGVWACSMCGDFAEDALHYLKEYRETKKHLACLDVAEIRGDDTQVINNPPLTWDELKQMAGKPVWIEIGLLPPRWFLIEGFNGDQMVGVDALSVRVPFYKDGFGPGRCQAYRKELGNETGN